MPKKLLIIGGNGHGSVVASCIQDNNRYYNNQDWIVDGFLNDYETNIDEYPVVGKLTDVKKYIDQGYYFSYAIHLIGRNPLTESVFNRLKIPEDRLATIIHHSAFISENVKLEPGCFVMSNAYIGPRSHLGIGTLVKANVCIGHDVVCGPLCHFAMGSIVGSFSEMGTCCDVATGSVVLEKKHIGDFSMLGAHSLLTHDMLDHSIYFGSPAKFIRKIKES